MTHFVQLPTSLPSELISDLLGKLHYVSEDLASFRWEGGSIQFETHSGREIAAEIISARICEIAAKMCNGHREFQPRTLLTRKPANCGFNENPWSQLEDEGNLFQFGPGRVGLGPLPVRLEAFFENGLCKLADQLGAVRHRFPALVGAEVLQRCRYIQSFPHALSLVSHLREDLEAIQKFAREIKLQDGAMQFPPESVGAPKCLLAPTVCFHYYAWLRDRAIDAPTTITALGHCFRYESGAMATLERLWDFTMREIVFVGPRDYVLEQRDKCIRLTSALLDEWNLNYEIKSATDPFFIEEYSTQTAFQSAFELKFEIRADLPYLPGKSLAVGSFNYHQDFFGRSLAIQGPGELPAAFTGCVGFGMERLIWAFLSQHGPDPANWPNQVRAAMNHGAVE